MGLDLYVAAGYFQLLKTSDGGSTWFDKLDQVGGWLDATAVAFASPSVPCIVGSGRILRSTDAGDTWPKPLSYADYPMLFDVSFPVPGIGIAVGDNGLILRSTDEGASWKVVQSGQRYYLTSVAMSDAMNGICVGRKYGDEVGLILRTVDGGLTWTPSSAPPSTYFSDVQWISSSMQVIVGALPNYNPAVFVTTNGGATWRF